ncbi:MAG TPA: hypothetical protein PLP42_06445 [Acidobacteriota bacterium]|nr:hypothetical protein [Acidobacteriota bacterium]
MERRGRRKELGPEPNQFIPVLAEFSKYCEEHAQLRGIEPEVNVVFHLPGSLLKPDYVGLRSGTFSKKRRAIMVQAAVEPEFIAQLSRSVIRDYILDVAEEVLGIAARKFEEAGIPYDINKDWAFLDSYRKRFVS